jgi:hypothetical protein
MAEIKSALELAMERSKRFSISDREREEIKRREVEQKATGLFHRYLDGNLSLPEILKEIGRTEEKTGTTIKELLLSQWIEALSLKDEDERLLKGIEALKDRGLDEIRERLQGLSRSFSEETEAIRRKAEEEMADQLRGMGIYGSAVEPNITENRELQNLLGGVDRAYQERIREVKEALRRM